MSYNENLFNRVESLLKSTKDIVPKKMFGGICFLHRGNMLCGIDKDRLLVRVGPDQYKYALSLAFASEMDITGRPLKGFVLVGPGGTESSASLKKWINLGLNFTRTLAAKTKKSKVRKGK
jgi:hypothetical protein